MQGSFLGHILASYAISAAYFSGKFYVGTIWIVILGLNVREWRTFIITTPAASVSSPDFKHFFRQRLLLLVVMRVLVSHQLPPGVRRNGSFLVLQLLTLETSYWKVPPSRRAARASTCSLAVELKTLSQHPLHSGSHTAPQLQTKGSRAWSRPSLHPLTCSSCWEKRMQARGPHRWLMMGLSTSKIQNGRQGGTLNTSWEKVSFLFWAFFEFIHICFFQRQFNSFGISPPDLLWQHIGEGSTASGDSKIGVRSWRLAPISRNTVDEICKIVAFCFSICLLFWL